MARLPQDHGLSTLPSLLRSSLRDGDQDKTNLKLSSIAFDLLLDVLRQWKPPEHDSKEGVQISETFALLEPQATELARYMTRFLLYDPKAPPANFNDDFRATYQKHYLHRSDVVPNVARFLFTPIFSDPQRFAAAVVLSVDANADGSSIADTMFKQRDFDLESDDMINILHELYDTGKPRLQTRVLNLLSRSQKSTRTVSKIVSLVEELLSANTPGLEGAKLRVAVFSYLKWTIRMNPDFGTLASHLQTSLKEYVELQGWPIPSHQSITENELRAQAYEAIGLLAEASAKQLSANPQSQLDLIVWLFSSLRCDTSGEAKHSVEEALSRVMNNTRFSSDAEAYQFKQFLLWNVLAAEEEEDPIYFLPTKRSTRYPAARFVNKCFPFSDIDARYMDLLVLDSNRREEVEEGSRGLDPYWHNLNSKMVMQENLDIIQLPDLSKFLSRAFDESRKTAKEVAMMGTQSVLSAAITFARNILAAQAWIDSPYDIRRQSDWKRHAEVTLGNDVQARNLFKMQLSKLNLGAAGILLKASLAGMSMGAYECANISVELLSLAEDTVLKSLGSGSLQHCETASTKASVQWQACRSFGILSSLTTHWLETVHTELEKCRNWKDAVGSEVLNVKSALLKTVFTISRASLRQPATIQVGTFGQVWSLISDIVLNGRDKTLRETSFQAIGQICLCISPALYDGENVSKLVELILPDAKKENEHAVAAIGRLVSFSLGQLGTEQREKVIEGLFGLHEIRKSEFQFALGEALAVAALGFTSTSTLAELDVDVERPTWGLHRELFEELLDKTIGQCKSTKPSLKKAASIWLLSLVQFCADDELLRPRLRDCQNAFSRLLTDRDTLVQETGSRGLGLVYERGDKNLQDDLVRDLVQSFTAGNAKMSGTVDEDTQLFEQGALPTENGQSVTTYKDIVSLAQEMGDPSLVYRFMNLASNNAIWSSRAAFGRFGLSGVLADSSYLKQNKHFYPKLFRYRFDPNPSVQRSMDEIWKALVKDPVAVIDENFDFIIEDLLKSIVLGKDWRAREASCAAIIDLLQGREIDKYEKYLDDVWKVAFKVLDDVKETVRAAAMKLCRTLTHMLIQNLEVGVGTTKRAKIMLNHAIPFLLERMEGGSAKEVQQYAVVTLLEVVKKAPARSIQSFAPLILGTLVNALSSLEHESINYLHLNADKYGLTADKLDKMRVSSINASPVTEAIERCLESLRELPDPEQSSNDRAGIQPARQPLPEAMTRLEACFKTAIGLPSRVGLSKIMITLVVRHQSMFRPYADRFTRLTRKNIMDRNTTISLSFSMALGYLVRVASEKEIRQTSQYAQKLYFESTEVSHRAVAAEIIEAISKASNDVFLNFATLFLPLAYVGRHDLDAEVRQKFDLSWKDNVGGSHGLKLYLKEIAELISIHVKSNLWPIRHACCLAVAGIITSMEAGQQYKEGEARLLWPLVEESLSGKTWDGKEAVVSAFPKFVKKSQSLWPEYTKQMKTIAFREAKRTNVSYRPHAISSLGEFAGARADLELAAEILPILTNTLDTILDPDAMDVDDRTDTGATR